jgi:hypothetical protein
MAKPNNYQSKQPQTVKAEDVSADTVIQARSVVGLLIDPFTNISFTAEFQPVAEVTGWMQSQIDARKMEVI